MIRRKMHAFTVIELMVVIAIILLLVALLVPSLNRARSSGRTGVCASNLHQQGNALSLWRAQNRPTTSCGITSLLPFVTNGKIFACPADSTYYLNGSSISGNSGNIQLNAQVAVYSGGTCLYDMPIGSGDWTYQNNYLPDYPGGYSLNYEDQNGTNVSDYSFYNYYLVVQQVNPCQFRLISLATAPAGDVTPPTCRRSGGPGTAIYGGYQFQIVDLNGNPLSSGFFLRGAGDFGMLIAGTGTSYGMNTIFAGGAPNMITTGHDGIVICDYLTGGAAVAGTNRASGQFTTGLASTADRPGLARHAGAFNALFLDYSVRTGLNPKIVNPDTSPYPTNTAYNRQQWWGE